MIWQQAQPVRTARDASTTQHAGTLTPEDRRLLELLANGLTDESISSSLGWSLRTVQRHVAR